MRRAGTYLSHAVVALSEGLCLRTFCFVVAVRLCFHSYDSVTDSYVSFFRIGSATLSFESGIYASYVVPIVFLFGGLFWASHKPVAWVSRWWVLVGAVVFAILSELAFWIVIFVLGISAHFTTGDVFSPGVG